MDDEAFNALILKSGIVPTKEQLDFMKVGYSLAISRLLDMADEALAAGEHAWREVLLDAADSL